MGLTGLVCALPPWLAVTLPLGLIAMVDRFIRPPVKLSKDLLRSPAVEVVTAEQTARGFPSREERSLDVVVLGATGLTGGALADYLVTEHPSLKIGLAGRTLSKLQAVKDALPGHPDVELIVADTGDAQSLFEMCRRGRVIATTVGPFARFGNLAYHACALSGTHYCDITGEPAWVNHMAKLYGAAARKSGASLVSYSGVDSVPSDLGAYLVCRKFTSAHGAEGSGEGSGACIEHVEAVVTRFKGAAPAGTIETIAGVVDSTDALQAPPLVEYLDGPAAAPPAGKTKVVGLGGGVSDSAAFVQSTTPFFMAATNASAVRSSNAARGYAKKFSYTERWGFPDTTKAAQTFLGLYVMGLPWVALPMLRGLARSAGALPQPNAGANAEANATTIGGSVVWLVAASGTDASGAAAAATLRLSGLGSAGVGFTAVCHGEVAALLAVGHAEARAGAGLPPVGAVGGDRLAVALEKTGLVFVDDVPEDLLRASAQK